MWKRALLRKHLGVLLFSLCRGKRVSTGLSELFKCKQLKEGSSDWKQPASGAHIF